MVLRRFLTKLPGGSTLLRWIRNARTRKVSSSRDYWEERYREGGDSGAGSYGRLAQFKAEFLNSFVAQHDVKSVIEFGSGDGSQLALANYPSYVGVDVSRTAVDKTRELYRDRAEMTFLHSSECTRGTRADLSLSLDVIYHLVEDSVYEEYMNRLFDAATRFAIIYSSNEESGPIAPHVRHRRFSSWVARHRRDFELIGHERNPFPEDRDDPINTSFADFYVYERKRST
jgi:predicted O-methyltransferase YrrM